MVTHKNRSQPLFSWILKSRIIFHLHLMMSWLLSLIYLNTHLFNFSENIYWPVAMCPVCVSTQSLSCVQLFGTLWTLACQAPLPMEFSRQEYWSGLHALLQGSTWPRNQIWVSCIAEEFFTLWATKEVPLFSDVYPARKLLSGEETNHWEGWLF